MQKAFEGFGWKKITLVLFIIVIVIILLLILSFLFEPKASKVVEKNASVPAPVSRRSSGVYLKRLTPTSSPRPTAIPGWQVYEDVSFHLEYPSEWTVESSRLMGGGAVSTFYPKYTTDGYPRVDVYRYTRQDHKKIAQLTQDLLASGAQKSFGTFLGKPVTVMTWLIEGNRFVQGNSEKKDVLKDLYIFEDQGVIYEVAYAYFRDSKSQSMKAELQKIVATFISKEHY